jgi:hypothetical protein
LINRIKYFFNNTGQVNEVLSENKTKTIVTIGDGIAAWCLHYYLKDEKNIQIINVSAPDFFPACSRSTTSINCLRGAKPGVSKLGETIRAAMFEFEKFNQLHAPDGVTPGTEFQILDQKTYQVWARRYPEFFEVKNEKFIADKIKNLSIYYPVEAYYIAPNKLEKWLKKDVTNVDYKKSLVQKVSKVLGEESSFHYDITTLDFGVIKADEVVICTNHQASMLMGETLTDKFRYYIDHCKPVSGSFLELENASKYGIKFDRSFSFAIELNHFIYRHEEDLLQIGASSINRDITEMPRTKELQEIYQVFKDETYFDLPDFSKFTQRSGIRHKGYRREPFWGKVDNAGLYVICGLYKNAFSFGFLAGSELKQQLNS